MPNIQASSLSRIRRLKHTIIQSDGKRQTLNSLIYKQYYNKSTGYMTINLRINGHRFTKNVNTLVATAFIPNPKNLSDVHHKNYNKKDNRPENLEWKSHKDNVNDMQSHYNIKRGAHSKYKHYNKKGYLHKCKYCNKLCESKASMCINCYNKQRQATTYSINKIQKLLYEYDGNFSKVGKLINKSGSGIAKRLKNHKLPYHSKDYQKKQP